MTRTRFARITVVLGIVAATTFVAGPPADAAPQWTIVKSPSPASPPVGRVSAVSCGGPKSCFAVGSGSTGPLIERWNGTGWAVVRSPTFGGNALAALDAISCSSATHCIAVGYVDTSTGSSFSEHVLAERWNGRQWSVIASPESVGNREMAIGSISCVSAKSCFAVGYTTDDAEPTNFEDIGITALIQHWNGSTWKVMPSPAPRGALLSILSGVSCSGPKHCFAVGDYFSRTSGGALIERWNGSRWSIVASPAQGNFATPRIRPRLKPGAVIVTVSGGLSSVSCVSKTSCFAVGGGFTGAPVIERWNGTKWSIVPSPVPPNGTSGQLASVSCASPTDCSAVGTAFSSSGIGSEEDFSIEPLAEHWNGSGWSIVAQPHGARFTSLSSVSCPAANNCAAAGGSPFVQRWNGIRWKIAPFTTKASQSELLDISCLGAASCFAVGDTSDGVTVKPLIERRVGSRWTIVPSPSPSGATETVLNSVSCASVNDCTAVGSSYTFTEESESEQAVIEHWNGSTWTLVPSPTPADSFGTTLYGVSCASATSCTAVGSNFTRTADLPLIEYWNGATWSIIPAPNPPFGVFDSLTSVSCSGPAKCTAVGYYGTYTGDRRETIRTFIERWDGASWTLQPSPNVKGADYSVLLSVSCPGPTNCSAVGVSESGAGTDSKPMAQHWNGRKWALVPVPNPRRSIRTNLTSISCRGTSSCYAVGFFSTVATTRTLVEHWNGSRWVAIASPNPAGATGAGLNGVSCASRHACTAVGSYGAGNGFFTLIERGP